MKNLFRQIPLSCRKGRAREEPPYLYLCLLAVSTATGQRPWNPSPLSAGDHPSGGKLKRPQQALPFVVTVTVFVGLENSKSLC